LERHAKQTEKLLAELSKLFGKMSNLVVSQGETLDTIGDDVETTHTDVAAGQAEIQILYSLKKATGHSFSRPCSRNFCYFVHVAILMIGRNR
jgi:t-SNARE complex subunit (syntaxin)